MDGGLRPWAAPFSRPMMGDGVGKGGRLDAATAVRTTGVNEGIVNAYILNPTFAHVLN